MKRRKQPEIKYPVGQAMSRRLRSGSGVRYEDINLESLRHGKIRSGDLSIDADTLRMQARVATASGYSQLASNLKRAAELVSIPSERLLEIYSALRPRHSTYLELSKISTELLRKYRAPENARFVREAAKAYRDAGLLRPTRTSP